MLETASGSPALEKALRPLLESRLPAEEEFAARAVACTVPIDRATAILQDRCLARPASPSTAALLDWLLECRPSIIFDPGDNRQNELMLFDAVLESHSAPLQCRFINYLRRRQMTALDSSALFLTYITETEPDAFYALLGSYASFMDYSKFPGTPKWFAIDAALERLAGLIRPADGKPNLPALAALSDFLRHMRNSNVINERREKIFAMITPFLSTCFRPNAPDGEIEMGGEMVEFLLGEAMAERSGAGLTWKDLPPAVQAACCMWLSYANHEAHGHKVAALLSSCYERPGPWGSHSIKPPENPTAPELLKAMENARAAIMEKGGPHDQLLLLYGLAQCPDEAPAKEAMSELERRLLAGTIPTELAGNASATLYGGGTMQWDELPYAALRTWLARWKGPLSPELVRHLLDRISEPADRPRGALGPVRLLAGQPGMAEPLLAALQQVAKDRPDLLSDAVEAADVLRTEIEQARNEGRPDPPWTRAAGDLALQMAAAADFYHAREQAMPLYRVALGPKAAQTIEAMVLDEHIDPGLRAAAASQLFDAKSDTKILPAFTAKYERLPVDLRDALGSAVARTAEAEGGAEFLELFLADKQMPTDRRRIAVFRLRLQPTPRLRALLDKLANDPDLGNAIAQAIKRLDAEAAKRNGKPQENPQ